MDFVTCRGRLFPLRINVVTFYPAYLRWLRHMSERLGLHNALLIWRNTFIEYDDALLMSILSSGWHNVAADEGKQVEDSIHELVEELLPTRNPEFSGATARNVIEDTPPILQIRRLFSVNTVEKDITAYDALHLRFDGLAYLAEALIETYGKQGELIAYDLMIEERRASSKGETGSVEQFIEKFTAKPDEASIFTAGLEIELISKRKREAVVHVRECEWARYFQERHPRVGYLMACSTDEAGFKAFNRSLRLQRTRTIMEGGDTCDFRIYAVDGEPNQGE